MLRTGRAWARVWLRNTAPPLALCGSLGAVAARLRCVYGEGINKGRDVMKLNWLKIVDRTMMTIFIVMFVMCLIALADMAIWSWM